MWIPRGLAWHYWLLLGITGRCWESLDNLCDYQVTLWSKAGDPSLSLGTMTAAAAAAAKSLQSCPTLCDPIEGDQPGSPVPGILQARTLEWVAISFSKVWKWKVKVKSLSRVRLFATPWTAAYQAPPSMGFSRQEYWSGLPLPSLTSSPMKPKVVEMENSDFSSGPPGVMVSRATLPCTSWSPTTTYDGCWLKRYVLSWGWYLILAGFISKLALSLCPQKTISLLDQVYRFCVWWYLIEPMCMPTAIPPFL